MTSSLSPLCFVWYSLDQNHEHQDHDPSQLLNCLGKTFKWNHSVVWYIWKMLNMDCCWSDLGVITLFSIIFYYRCQCYFLPLSLYFFEYKHVCMCCFAGLLSDYHSSFLIQRIPLDFLQGEKFHEAVDNYIRPLLTKVFVVTVQAVLVGFSIFARIMYSLLVVFREFLRYSQIFHHYMTTLERWVWFLVWCLYIFLEVVCSYYYFIVWLKAIFYACSHSGRYTGETYSRSGAFS